MAERPDQRAFELAREIGSWNKGYRNGTTNATLPEWLYNTVIKPLEIELSETQTKFTDLYQTSLNLRDRITVLDGEIRGLTGDAVVERIARAMHAADHKRGWIAEDNWDDINEQQSEDYLILAGAALAELREGQ